MLFSELYKIMVNEVTFLSFREGDWIRPGPGLYLEWTNDGKHHSTS